MLCSFSHCIRPAIKEFIISRRYSRVTTERHPRTSSTIKLWMSTLTSKTIIPGKEMKFSWHVDFANFSIQKKSRIKHVKKTDFMTKRADPVIFLFPLWSLITGYVYNGHNQFIQSSRDKVSVRKASSFCDRGRLNISRYLRDAVFSWRPVKLLICRIYG